MSVDRTTLPRLGPEPTFHFPRIDRHVVGALRVVVVERHDVPVLTMLLLVPAGAAADPDDRHGLAALTADLLDEGSCDRDALAFHRALGRLGAELDIDVNHDATFVTLETLSRHRDRALALVAELALRPRFDAADFDRVRGLRQSRLRQLRNVPAAVADRVFVEQVFGPHPYGHQAIGTETSLERMALDDVRAFHRTHLALAGATLIAVGDVSPNELVVAIEREVGAPAAVPAVATPPVAAPQPRPRWALVDRPGAPQSELRVGRIGAPRSTPDYFPLIVLNTVVGGQFVSRINLNLREDKGLTYGARSAFEFRRQPGTFSVQTSVQTDATGRAVAEVLRELADVGGTRPVTAEELIKAKATLTRGYPRGFEMAEQVARHLAALTLYELDDDYFDRFAGRVAAVSAADVTRAAAEYLAPVAQHVVVVGDRAQVGPQLEALGLGHIEETTL